MKGWRRHALNKLLSKKILKTASAVTTISRDLKTRIQDIAGVDARIIHCGVDTKKFVGVDGKQKTKLKNALGLAPDKKTILTVGRLIDRKNYSLLIRSFKEVCNENKETELVFVGDGPQHQRLQLLVKKLGLEREVEFKGFVEEENLIKYYQASDIFAISSLHEGQCCTILEAMACAKPIVATGVGGIPDSVEEGRNGLLVPPDDINLFGSALRSLIDDEKKATQFGAHSRKRTQEKFDWDVIAEQTRKVYEESI